MDWLFHMAVCSKCQHVNANSPRTFVNACHEGTVALKEYLHAQSAPKIAAARRAAQLINKDENRATPKQLAEVMRYK